MGQVCQQAQNFSGEYLATDGDVAGEISLPIGREKTIKKGSPPNWVSSLCKNAPGQLDQLI
jgi:hypothetical protein